MLEETVASFCLSQTLILLTRPTSTPPPRRLLFPESHPRACQITFFIASRQKAIWSSWSPLSVGCRSQGLLPGPPIKSHPTPPPRPGPLYFSPPASTPSSAGAGAGVPRLCYLVLEEQCGLSACINIQGKAPRFQETKILQILHLLLRAGSFSPRR